MLTQQRTEIILKLLKEKGSITVTEVRDLLDTSESTVRRDITALDKEGKLEKVFGGAVEPGQKVTAHEYTVAQKNELNCDAKRKNRRIWRHPSSSRTISSFSTRERQRRI